MGYELVMTGQDRRKSRLISKQKPLRRRKQTAKRKADRKRVDLIELHTQFVGLGRQRKVFRFTWIKVLLFFIAVPGFFILGYYIAALSVSTTVKVMIAFPIAILGIILSYIVASAFR
jgi:hypothetical protein